MYRIYEPWPSRGGVPNTADSEMIATARSIAEGHAAQGFNLTLRQLYYQFVAHHGLANSDQSYKRLGEVINKGRLAGLFDWDRLVDRTRTPVLPSFWESPTQIIRAAVEGYNTDKRADQPVHVEVWVEKEALAEIADVAAGPSDVPSFSCRGYTSASAMWRAARRLLSHVKRGQAVRILHLGDHDPSGIDMTRDITDRLERFLVVDWLNEAMDDEDATRADIWEHMRQSLTHGAFDPFRVERIALNMDQIEEHEPPPNPAKLSDSRAGDYVAQFGYESWELDSLDPEVLVELIRDRIAHYTDQRLLARQQDREDEERRDLDALMERWDEVRDFLNGEAS